MFLLFKKKLENFRSNVRQRDDCFSGSSKNSNSNSTHNITPPPPYSRMQCPNRSMLCGPLSSHSQMKGVC